MSKNEVFAKDADDCLIIEYSGGDEEKVIFCIFGICRGNMGKKKL